MSASAWDALGSISTPRLSALFRTHSESRLPRGNEKVFTSA